MLVLYKLAPILLIFGLILSVTALKKRREHRRYQFEHRTTGGVVEFPSFEAAQSFNRSVMFWDLAKVLGFMSVFLGLTFLMRC